MRRADYGKERSSDQEIVGPVSVKIGAWPHPRRGRDVPLIDESSRRARVESSLLEIPRSEQDVGHSISGDVGLACNVST
ncbi:MAG: hypothetical protein ACREIU_04695, partial [Planctomycetota bacterium]